MEETLEILKKSNNKKNKQKQKKLFEQNTDRCKTGKTNISFLLSKRHFQYIYKVLVLSVLDIYSNNNSGCCSFFLKSFYAQNNTFK